LIAFDREVVIEQSVPLAYAQFSQNSFIIRPCSWQNV